MKDYNELVEALRYCAESGDFKCGKDCPMHTEYPNCLTKMDTDAAAAIEALQAAEPTEKQVVDYCHKRCLVVLGADLFHELKASYGKLPKRGKWITIRLNNGGSYTGCSCCEAPIPTDTMLDYIPESESKYCYSCGAKMEVQE